MSDRLTSAAPAAPPTARQLRSRLRHARRRHHSRALGDLLTDLYLVGLVALMYGYLVVDVARDHLGSAATERADPGARWWIAVAVLLAGVGLAWQGLRTVGPLMTTPAMYTWFISTPVDRRRLLTPRLLGLLAGAAAAIALLGFATATALDGHAGYAALAGAVCGVALAGLTVAAQPVAADGRRRADRVATLFIGGAALIVGAVIATQAVGARMPQPAARLDLVLGALGLPLAAVATAGALRALPRLDRATLTGGVQLASATVTAVMSMDASMLSGVVEARRWRRIGRVRSRHFLPGGRVWVLLQAEVRRQWRRPRTLAVCVALGLVQYSVAIAAPTVAGAAQLIGAYLVADRLAGGLRTICRSPGLRRAIGGRDATLHLTHLVIPVAGTLLWWLATWPAGGADPGTVERFLVAGVLVALYRAATRPPMNYGGPAVDTPFGLIPVDLIRQITRGPDVLAIVIVVQWFLSH